MTQHSCASYIALTLTFQQRSKVNKQINRLPFNICLLTMLATVSASTEPQVVLDVVSSNWTPYKKQVLRLLQTKYGVMGSAIILGIAPVIAAEPTRDDLNPDGSATYRRLPPTAEQLLLPAIPLTALDLTPFGYDMLRDAIKRHLDQKKINEKDDNDLLSYLFSTMSSESHLALETHPTYPTFRAALSGQKSFACWTILTAIHSTGNASTKLLRTRLLLNSQQSDSTLSQYLQTLSSNIDQFKVDFGSPTNPELDSVAEIHCFLMLTGIPSNGLFNLPINNLLAATPTARFTDPAALAATLLNWEKSSALLHLSTNPSTQASAYLATPPEAPTKSNTQLTVFCIHCHKRYPKKPKTNSHTSASCGLNPSNKPVLPPTNFSAMRSLLAQAEAATPGSPTSLGLLMQITESAFDESLKTST